MTTFRCKMVRSMQLVAASVVMMATSMGGAVGAQNIVVPSGQTFSFLEFISEQNGDVVRFRFLTPDIGASFEYADVVTDFAAVCAAQVLPVLAENQLDPSKIVMSMSAADVPFGDVNNDVLQFFEVFRVENGTCIWEEF